MPLAVDRYELGPIGTNCYVVRNDRGATDAVVIDPGADAADLRLELARMGARCVAILITHGHYDHLGAVADLAGITFETIRVPGHSPAHLSYYADGALFSGDVLFAGSVGRTDLPGGDWETLVASIRTLAERFPPETVVYSGHGPPTTLGDELARNPFLSELRTS